jgi:hypothetical protein
MCSACGSNAGWAWTCRGQTSRACSRSVRRHSPLQGCLHQGPQGSEALHDAPCARAAHASRHRHRHRQQREPLLLPLLTSGPSACHAPCTVPGQSPSSSTLYCCSIRGVPAEVVHRMVGAAPKERLTHSTAVVRAPCCVTAPCGPSALTGGGRGRHRQRQLQHHAPAALQLQHARLLLLLLLLLWLPWLLDGLPARSSVLPIAPVPGAASHTMSAAAPLGVRRMTRTTSSRAPMCLPLHTHHTHTACAHTHLIASRACRTTAPTVLRDHSVGGVRGTCAGQTAFGRACVVCDCACHESHASGAHLGGCRCGPGPSRAGAGIAHWRVCVCGVRRCRWRVRVGARCRQWSMRGGAEMGVRCCVRCAPALHATDILAEVPVALHRAHGPSLGRSVQTMDRCL